MNELWDIYDEDGNKEGVEYSNIVHKEGYLHKTVILAVIKENNKFLIQKRPVNRKVDPGKYDFFGGHLKSGENYTDACFRELSEELGINKDRIRRNSLFQIGKKGAFPYYQKKKDYIENEISTLYAYFLSDDQEIKPTEIFHNGKTCNLQTFEKSLEKLCKLKEDQESQIANGMYRVLDKQFAINHLSVLLTYDLESLKTLGESCNCPLKGKRFMNNCFITNRDCVELNTIKECLSDQWRPQIFVVMKFAGYQNYYDEIKKKFEKLFHITRSDEINEVGYITCGNICKAIQRSEFVFVLLPREENENVYYELGIAYGLKRKIILLRPINSQIEPFRLFPELFNSPIDFKTNEIPFKPSNKPLDFHKLNHSDNNILFLFQSKNNLKHLIDKVADEFQYSIKSVNIDQVNELEIFKNLISSEIVIIQISKYNLAIYFWLGVAHGLQKHTITLIRGKIGLLPFDIRSLNLLTYNENVEENLFIRKLSSVINKIRLEELNIYSKLWKPIIERGNVKIVIGIQELRRERRVAVGNWDIMALSKIVSFLNRKSSTMNTEIMKPFSIENEDINSMLELMREEWKNCDLIIFGSPDVNLGTALALECVLNNSQERTVIKERENPVVSEPFRRFFSTQTEIIHKHCIAKELCERKNLRWNRENLTYRDIHGLKIKQESFNKILGVCHWLNRDKNENFEKYIGFGHVLVSDNPFCDETCECFDSPLNHKLIIIEGLTGPATLQITKLLCGGYDNKNFDSLLEKILKTMNTNQEILEFLVYGWIQEQKNVIETRDNRKELNLENYIVIRDTRTNTNCSERNNIVLSYKGKILDSLDKIPSDLIDLMKKNISKN